jgi:hypothetical protein
MVVATTELTNSTFIDLYSDYVWHVLYAGA